MIVRILVIMCIFLSMLYATQKVSIGVLAFRTDVETLKEWTDTVNYLNKKEPQYVFTILPLDMNEINGAVKDRTIDFVITNPAHYVYLEKLYHVSRIATMLRYSNGGWQDRFGGVIFTKANRSDIQTIVDLKGKLIAAVNPNSFGGYLAQEYECLLQGVDKESLHVSFAGLPHENVVQQVVENKADVGFVRTDVLEHMASEGKIDLHSLKIVHPKNVEGFPYYLSTSLYPEWAFARLPHTNQNLSNQVVVALLTEFSHKEAQENNIGWTAPLEYHDIHNVLQAFQISPYDQPVSITIGAIYQKYAHFIWILLGFSGLILIMLIIEMVIRQKLLYESYKNEAFLTLSGDGIHILDEKGNIVQVSKKFCRMLGYSREEMIGMNVLEWDTKVKKEEFIQGVQNLSEETITVYSQHKRKNGTVYDAEITVTLINTKRKSWIYCSARDVTANLIEQANNELAVLVYEHSSDAIIITDPDGTIISVNPSFTLMTDYTLEELKDKSTNVLNSGQQTKDFFRQLWETLETQGEWNGEIIDRDKNGTLFSKWLSIRTVYDNNNEPYRRIAIFSDITDQKEVKQKLWYQANFDTLTGLSNRSMFMYRLEKELQLMERNESLVVLMYLDLDHFKEINDTLGHDKGDILLQIAAKRLTECVRKSDIVSRLGGDEFTIILNDIDSLDSVNEIARKIIDRLSSPFYVENETLFISVSIGITIAPSDGDTSEILLKNADQAMYAAKNEGRNRYHYFTFSMQENLNQRTLMIHEMRKSIEKYRFKVYYQPIMELTTGSIYKAEALVRWEKEDGSIVSPLDFIPLAEETGLINDIGALVFEQAVQQAKVWRKKIAPNFQISVNKSPVQFRCEQHQCSTLVEIMQRYIVSHDAIIVEITEGILMENSSIIKHKLLELESQGILVALDDFGTGYSSLSYLKKFDIDYIKIDKSFVQNVEHDYNDQILCEAIIAMAHKLEIKVIAEGVETIEQKNYLEKIQCDYIQGYLVAKPMPPDQFEIFYQINQTKEN